jgi:hypothetical protein
MTTKKPTDRQLSAFAKAARKSYKASLAGTKAAERTNVLQSADLRPYWAPSRPVEMKQ